MPNERYPSQPSRTSGQGCEQSFDPKEPERQPSFSQGGARAVQEERHLNQIHLSAKKKEQQHYFARIFGGEFIPEAAVELSGQDREPGQFRWN